MEAELALPQETLVEREETEGEEDITLVEADRLEEPEIRVITGVPEQAWRRMPGAVEEAEALGVRQSPIITVEMADPGRFFQQMENFLEEHMGAEEEERVKTEIHPELVAPAEEGQGGKSERSKGLLARRTQEEEQGGLQPLQLRAAPASLSSGGSCIDF